MTTAITRIDQPTMEPWFFDPIAWWQDTRELSEGARAVWFDMLCMMHCAKPRGFLVHPDGSNMTDDFLSRKMRIQPLRMTQYLEEIKRYGKYSIDDKGRIYSRRMVRERRRGEDLRTVAERYQENPPAALLAWIDWWNRLAEKRLVTGFLTRSKPPIELCRAWVRIEKNAEVLGLLARKNEIERQLELATLDMKWLSLASLFGGKNGDGEYKVRRLLEGRYGSAEKQSGTIQKLSGLAAFAKRAGGR